MYICFSHWTQCFFECRRKTDRDSLHLTDMTQTIKVFVSATPVIISSHHGTGIHFARLLHLFSFTKRLFCCCCRTCVSLPSGALLCEASCCLSMGPFAEQYATGNKQQFRWVTKERWEERLIVCVNVKNKWEFGAEWRAEWELSELRVWVIKREN